MDFEGRGATHVAVFFGYLFVCAFFVSEGFFAFSCLYFSLFSSVFLFVFVFSSSFPDFVESWTFVDLRRALSSEMLLFVLRACCAVVAVHAKSQSKWNGVVLIVFLRVFASTVDLAQPFLGSKPRCDLLPWSNISHATPSRVARLSRSIVVSLDVHKSPRLSYSFGCGKGTLCIRSDPLLNISTGH